MIQKTVIRHKSTGNKYNAEIYTSFVYLIDELRKITIEDFNDFFELINDKCDSIDNKSRVGL